AALTERLTIGTAVLLAPLYDPIRLAEDAATVDLISQGRFILGLGAGWRAEEFDRLGKSMDQLGKQMSEIVKILRASWGPSLFSFEGKRFHYEPTNVTPKPTRPIPVYLGGFADDALRRAGRIGDGFVGSSSRGGDLSKYLELVHEGIVKSGRDPSTFPIAMHFRTWVTDEPDEIDELLPHIWNMAWKYQDMGSTFGRATDGPLPAAPAMSTEDREKIRSSMIYGDVGQVAEQVKALADQVGPNFEFIARSLIPGVSFDRTKKVISQLGEVRSLLV
ncbi:MAG: LLM class flavin-dependent oxidoreductase, partial [Actinobacteria bacterium]|nr:LLM class flavin-dependent oxidoreductase [Actinomycetota bacterium]